MNEPKTSKPSVTSNNRFLGFKEVLAAQLNREPSQDEVNEAVSNLVNYVEQLIQMDAQLKAKQLTNNKESKND